MRPKVLMLSLESSQNASHQEILRSIFLHQYEIFLHSTVTYSYDLKYLHVCTLYMIHCNYCSNFHVIKGSCDVSMRIRIDVVDSHLLLFSAHTLCGAFIHLNITPERFPHPSAYCCLECCPHLFCTLWTAS